MWNIQINKKLRECYNKKPQLNSRGLIFLSEKSMGFLDSQIFALQQRSDHEQRH